MIVGSLNFEVTLELSGVDAQDVVNEYLDSMEEKNFYETKADTPFRLTGNRTVTFNGTADFEGKYEDDILEVVSDPRVKKADGEFFDNETGHFRCHKKDGKVEIVNSVFLEDISTKELAAEIARREELKEKRAEYGERD